MSDDSLDTGEMVDSSEDFAAAYESHAPSIYKFLYWRTRDRQLAEDLTGDVFTKAWRARGSFSTGSVRAWLYRIARNVLTDYWRKKKELAVEDTDVLPIPVDTDSLSLSESVDQDLRLADLRKALDSLPAEALTVVTLRFIEGLSCKQVAERLHLGESNVRVIQYRALRKLREYLS